MPWYPISAEIEFTKIAEGVEVEAVTHEYSILSQTSYIHNMYTHIFV